MSRFEDADAVYKRLSRRFDRVIAETGAEISDVAQVAAIFKSAQTIDGEVHLDVTELSETQRALCLALVSQLEHGDAYVTYVDENRTESPAERKGAYAERLLLFVMDIDDVDARVGDALERLPEIQRRFGTGFGELHFQWTVVCFFFHAIFEKPLVKRLVDALFRRLGE
ncbi:MAG: hypothetical protein AAGA87_17975 [Pseudomonadota bacterium]